MRQATPDRTALSRRVAPTPITIVFCAPVAPWPKETKPQEKIVEDVAKTSHEGLPVYLRHRSSSVLPYPKGRTNILSISTIPKHRKF
jgi:hypothetical protein